MTIDRQSVLDAAWALLGGAIGGVAVGAFWLHRYLSTGHGPADKERGSRTRSDMSKPVTGLPSEDEQDPVTYTIWGRR